ncbi:hypothetical protein GGI15_003256 [Coemansia interrupta]|uniref:G-patch domain-containing protein n=1 Tax=Coemansia interrupta TaxID=1126814 RepID=A0A9W8LJ97_9FUNG|nr:hypothetical protein GGI15_003256 [Coemansia interrupta]
MDDEYGHRALGFDDSSEEEEFNDQRRKNARRNCTQQSKEDAMLGIWADDINDKGMDRGPVDVLRPLNFVLSESSAITETDTIPASQLDPSSSDPSKSEMDMQVDVPSNDGISEPETSSTSGQDSDSDSDSAAQSSDAESDAPLPHRAPIRDVKQAGSRQHEPPSKGFGKFANSAVWGMMAKMGYKPGEGLGKHGEGRVEPIQVHVRHAGTGIAFSGSERPQDTLKPASDRSSARGVGKRAQKQGMQTSTARPQIRKPKVDYKAIDELQTQTDTRFREIFVDMTTNTEVSSLSELVSQRIPTSEKDKLASDVRLGLDLAFARIEDHKRERAIEESKRAMLTREIQLLKLSTEKHRIRIECLKSVQQSIDTASTISEDVNIASSKNAKSDLYPLYTAYADMYKAAKQTEARCDFDVWTDLQLERAVTTTLQRHFLHLFQIWRPADHPQLLDEILAPLRTYVKTHDVVANVELLYPLESLLGQTLVPRLKQFVFTEWDPMSDVMTLLLDPLPPVVVAMISDEIGSVLVRFVNGVDPRAIMAEYKHAVAGFSKLADKKTVPPPSSHLDPLRLDRAVLPWLPYIYDRGEITSDIRRKLCTALNSWIPSKESNPDIMPLVSPWLELLHGKELRKLSSKVIERLELMLRSEPVFDAHGQPSWPFGVLVKWHPYLPFTDWFSLVKGQVLPKFVAHLRRWLEDPSANYAEIADWYWQWRQLYPSSIFEHVAVQAEFRKPLVYMAVATARRHQSS